MNSNDLKFLLNDFCGNEAMPWTGLVSIVLEIVSQRLHIKDDYILIKT